MGRRWRRPEERAFRLGLKGEQELAGVPGGALPELLTMQVRSPNLNYIVGGLLSSYFGGSSPVPYRSPFCPPGSKVPLQGQGNHQTLLLLPQEDFFSVPGRSPFPFLHVPSLGDTRPLLCPPHPAVRHVVPLYLIPPSH